MRRQMKAWRCQTPYSDAETEPAMEQALRREQLARLRQLAGEAIRRLKPTISQRRLELLIGLSQGYLSRLAAGNGNPSPALVALLLILAEAPAERLTELRRCWECPFSDLTTEEEDS